MKDRLIALVAGLTLLGLCPAALAQGAVSGANGGANRMADIMGPLAAAIDSRSAKVGWDLFFEDNWLVLVNAAEASSELYFTVPVGPVASGQRTTSLNVGIRPPQAGGITDIALSAVGILIESGDHSTSCVGEITGSGDGLVLCFDKDGKSQEMGRLAGAAKGGGQDLLQFVESPAHGDFLLNGQVIAHLDSHPALGGEVGVLAYERGEFYVGGFSVSAGDAAPPAAAAAGTDVPMFGSDSARLIGVYLGLTNSIFMHEFGHALIGELLIPSTGPEEDAVDIFSALRVVEPTMYPSGDPEIDAIGREVATYSALQWYYGGKLAEQQGSQTPWQDEHTPDLKRFRNVFCIMYGGNPGIFSDIAGQIGLDERTLARCDEEFNKQNRAWRTILAPHTRVGAWHPDGQLSADAPGAAIEVTFEPSSSRVGEFLRATFGDGIRGFADDLMKSYALPRKLTVTYRDCGELNAWYDPGQGSITMCYDLIEHLAVMIASIETEASQGGQQSQQNPGTGVADTSGAAASVSAIDEAVDLGVPVTTVLFPAPYKGPTPAGHAKARLITTEDLAAMLNKGEAPLLVDTSGTAQSIPGAVSVADAGKDGSLTDRFQSVVDSWLNDVTGGKRQTSVVFFGEGLNDRSSYNAALRAAALGWDAAWYRGGIEAWVSNGLPLAAAGASAPPQSEASTGASTGSGQRFAVYEGVDFYGADLAKLRADDLMQCFKACMENAQCVAMTMNLDPAFKSGPNCFLKDGLGRVERYEQAVSGVFLSPDFDGVLQVDGASVSPDTILE